LEPSPFIVSKQVILIFSLPYALRVIVLSPFLANVNEEGESKKIGVSSQFIISDKS
jgi:hypothetical protein